MKTLEEAFKKAQQMESDVDISIPTEKRQLEEKIEMLHKTIRELSLQKTNIWCSNCQEEGHTKYICRHQVVLVIQTHHFFEICRDFTQHLMTNCPYNLKKQKQYWCAICEEPTHNAIDYELNAKNHRVLYKTKVVLNDQNQSTNFRSNGYNASGGYNGRGRYNGRGGYNNQGRYQNNSTRRSRC